jgi:hypothetical protein
VAALATVANECMKLSRRACVYTSSEEARVGCMVRNPIVVWVVGSCYVLPQNPDIRFVHKIIQLSLLPTILSPFANTYPFV